MFLIEVNTNFRSGGNGRMAWGSGSLCYFYLLDRKVKEFMQRNLQSLGNLVDHAGGDVVFSPFNPPDLFAGISNGESKLFLGHILCQSKLAHPVSKGFQKIFVYHILHIQVWKFKKRLESPCMGYFWVFDYFCSKKDRL